jgi:hypothetical protein
LIELRAEGDPVLLLSRDKFRVALAALLVCLVTLLVVACEFHSPSHTHAHQAASGSHQSTSVDVPGDGLCLIAVLPAIAYVPLLLGVMFVAMPVFLSPVPKVFLMFRPPKLLLV